MCAVIAPIAILLLYIPVSRLKYVSSRNKIDCKKNRIPLFSYEIQE